MTVSRCLKGHPGHRLETRNRVQAAAERLGYRPNPLLTALVQQRRARRHHVGSQTSAATIAVLVRPCLVATPGSHAERILAGVFRQAQQLGYGIDVIDFDNDAASTSHLTRIIRARGISGAILFPMAQAGSKLAIETEFLAGACIGFSCVEPDLHRVSPHQFQAFQLALRQIGKAGYRRVGLTLCRDTNERVLQQYIGAYLAFGGAGQTPLECVSPLVVENYENAPRWAQRFRQWLKSEQPEVVISPDVELHERITNMGIHFPRDLSFVSLNRHGHPSDGGPVAGVDQNWEPVGSSAVDLVTGQLNRNERGAPPEPKLVHVRPRWVDGASLPNASR